MIKNEKSKLKRLIQLASISLFLLCANTFATDVLVETDTEVGRGLLREVGGTCFVYTPQHVAENSDGFVYVSSPQIRDAEASVLTFFPVDLALLKLPNENAGMCSKSSWQDGGNRVNAVLEVQKNGILSLRRKSGALSEIAVRFSSKDLHSYFYIQPENPTKQILQGMSGSIVYVGTYPVGMLVSVKDGIGKVLRIDTIANISKTVLDGYVSGLEKIASETADKSAFPSLNKKQKPIEHQPSLSNNVFSGGIVKGQVVEHRFITRGHTAYKLKLKRQSKGATISIDVLNPANKELTSLYAKSTGNDHLLGFGTIDAGKHIIRVSGFKDVGTYHMTLEEVASPEQLMGEANVMADGTSVTGYVAQNTYAEYRFIARGHTAYKLKLKRQSESIGVSVDVLNPANNTLASVYNESTGKDHLIGFGTVDAGEHIIRISGFRGVGTYHMTLEEVSSY